MSSLQISEPTWAKLSFEDESQKIPRAPQGNENTGDAFLIPSWLPPGINDGEKKSWHECPLLQNQTERKRKIRDHSRCLDGKLEPNNFLLSIKGYERGEWKLEELTHLLLPFLRERKKNNLRNKKAFSTNNILVWVKLAYSSVPVEH